MLNQKAPKQKPLYTFNFLDLVYKKWAVRPAKQEVIKQALSCPERLAQTCWYLQ